jgi:hypothetical protein
MTTRESRPLADDSFTREPVEMDEEREPVHWHAMGAEAVCARLDSGMDGLDESEAKQRPGTTGTKSDDLPAK